MRVAPSLTALGFSLVVSLVVSLAAAGCKTEDKVAKPAPVTLKTGTVSAEGVRTIEIEAGPDGYVPDRIPGKPGEKLKLKFTRTVDGECLAQVKTPDGKVVELPKGTATEIDVTVPATGEVKFACGMDMFFAVVVAEKA
ncbi:MAG: cupredoxin domain-containing protein [Deltaproteobacteria bacterium]|nr:cupredoxin domain-containing protein [Deltaproteobacteria bacterium]